MLLLLAVAVVLSLSKITFAACLYSNYSSSDTILVADENCKDCPICYINNKCVATRGLDINSLEMGISGVSAIGNMKNYTTYILNITDTSCLELKDMVLPDCVTNLEFNRVSHLNLTTVKASSWARVQSLSLVSCKNLVPFKKIQWPRGLTEIHFRDVGLKTLPLHLPESIHNFDTPDNQLTDLKHLPGCLNAIDLSNNSLESIIKKDWVHVSTLSLRNNPLKTLSNLKLSSALQYFDIRGCNLSNVTIDARTAEALNYLKQWDETSTDVSGFAIDKNISTNPNKFAVIGGVVQPLFPSQTDFKVTACIIPTKHSSQSKPSQVSNQSTTKPTPQLTTNMQSSASSPLLTIGVVVGVFVAITIAITVCICIRRTRKIPSQIIREQPNPHSDVFKISQLRAHRLELSDVTITGDQPLASGAYGEVWLGTYNGKKVAIKRNKSREPEIVQKFINEIIVMSKLESGYIVQFIGACWARPIEIQCVIEYMDMGDLRSYLKIHSPEQFTWDQKYDCIHGIIQGLVYLHTWTPPIIHRDLKSRNVLLDSVKGTKLTDFGTSRAAEVNESLSNNVGTYQWMAPEVVNGTRYTSQADIYSFGIILSELCTHQEPSSKMLHAESGELIPHHDLQPSFDGENVPLWVKDVAMRCLKANENDRPTALELFAMLQKVNLSQS